MLTVNETLGSLAAAYGGYSQFSTEDIGRALAGQHNNATPWPRPAGLARARVEEAAAAMADYWEDTGIEYADMLQKIEYGFILFVLGVQEMWPGSNFAEEMLADWAD
jgi:hypothetical protein